MRKYLLFTTVLLTCLLTFFYRPFFPEKKSAATPRTKAFPQPQEGEENEHRREQYEELRHRAAPNLNWRSIERENAKATLKQLRLKNARMMESFANGAITGVWSERGASNQAGSIRAVDYVAATNKLYTISNGGSLWSSVLGSGDWTLLNQGYRFNQRSISAFEKTGGGMRIVASVGEQVMYSDDEGVNFTPAAGITFPVEWGGNYVVQFVRLNDGSNTLYCLTRSWSDIDWAPRFWLYRSTDQGVSFFRIHTFSFGDDDRISLCNPHNTNELYAADIFSGLGSVKLYSITGVTVSLLNSFALATGNEPCLLKGTKAGSVTTLYLLTNNNAVYRSTNFGATWTLRSYLPEGAWMKMAVSMNNPDMISYGGVNGFRSTDGGASFTKVNDWVEYYSNVSEKLHADIMEIEYFQRTDNTEFAIINTHGGTYLSYDNLLTVSNQSLFSHHATEYYDVLTDTFHLDRIFGGTQDQGVQRTLTGTTPGVQPFFQLIGGDYGQLALTDSGRFLWPQYPGGMFFFYTNLDAPIPRYIGSWGMQGTQLPNFGWMLPVATTTTASANEIWMGGGNIYGGGGSYLIKLTMEKEFPYNITPTQLDYDFRANSNSGHAGITAIEQSLINPDKLYVGTEDGSFFYSVNGGKNWSRTTSFGGPGPWYLYGSSILASRKNQNLVWYAGSGYSNPGVYISTNGGATFAPMSNGLPPTLVNEIVASPNEDFLFAATEAGPFVYVSATDKWFPLTSNNMPVQFFTGVEYIRAENLVRFSTMGRGVWDFILTSGVPLPVTVIQFNGEYRDGNSLLTWSTSSESNSSHFIVQRSFEGVQFASIGKVAAGGNSNILRQYAFTDALAAVSQPLTEVFYRLQQVDRSGETKTSKVVRIRINKNSLFTVLNNPVGSNISFRYQSSLAETITLRLFDASGKTVLTRQFSVVPGVNTIKLDAGAISNGVYMAALQNGNETLTLRLLKQ